SGNHANTECSPNSPAVSGTPALPGVGRRWPTTEWCCRPMGTACGESGKATARSIGVGGCEHRERHAVRAECNQAKVPGDLVEPVRLGIKEQPFALDRPCRQLLHILVLRRSNESCHGAVVDTGDPKRMAVL